MAALWYAVTVRDGGDLWLHRTIKRNARGEVFVFLPLQIKKWPDDVQPELKKAGLPHATYHADGTVQQWNMFGRRPLPKRGQQKLDASFRCAEPLVTSPIDLRDLRKLGIKCLDSYADTFEISANKIPASGAIDSFQLSVDVAEPGSPEYPMGWTVVDQKAFKDRVPWVLVTLWKPTYI